MSELADAFNLSISDSAEGPSFFAQARLSAPLGSSVSVDGWGILNGSILLLFKGKPEPSEVADTLIGVENAAANETSPTSFTLTRGTETLAQFSTPDNASLQQWLQAIKDAAKPTTIQLSAEETQKLSELEAKLAEGGVSTAGRKKMEAIRFLKSKSWNVDQAFESYKDYLRWRKDFGVDGIKMRDVQKEIMSGKFEFLGLGDKSARPVMVLRPRYHSKNDSTVLSISQVIIYLMDRILEIAPDEQICIILDLAGISKESVDIRVPKTAFEIVTHRYPNSVGAYLIVNQPIFFSALWAVISRFMGSDIREKVQVLGDKNKLVNFVDKEKLPTDLGGTVEFNPRDYIRDRYKVEGFSIGQTSNATDNLTTQTRLMAIISSSPCVADVLPDCVKSGYMNKESGWIKRYQRQFFVVNDNVIYYFTNEKSKEPEGIIGLSNVKLEEAGDKIKYANAFCLVTALRTYNFYVDTDQEKKAWWDAITSQMLDV